MSYVPPVTDADPVLRSFNLRRARALAAGILWRARTAGILGNSLSIQTIDGKLVICRYSAHRSEVVQGAEASYLKHNLVAGQAVRLVTSTKQAYLCQVDFTTGNLTQVQSLGTFSYGTLISLGSKVVVNLVQPASEPNEIIIKPVTETYDLESVAGGWNTASLQVALGAAPIELCSTAVVDAPAPPAVMTDFSEVRLSGGAGLPTSPHEVYTGPTTAKAVLNYVELEDGTVAAAARLYTWVGKSASEGQWEPDDEVPIFYGVPTPE